MKGHRPFIASVRLFRERSDFFYGDCAIGADFDAALAAQAFVHIHGLGLAVLHLENTDGAGIGAFALPVTLLFVNRNLIHRFFHLLVDSMAS